MDNGMSMVVESLLSSTNGRVWHVSRVKGEVGDKVREREKGQGKWVHGGEHEGGMAWHRVDGVLFIGLLGHGMLV